MSLITDELVENVARGIAAKELGYYPLDHTKMEPFLNTARAALAVAVPAILEAVRGINLELLGHVRGTWEEFDAEWSARIDAELG